MGAESEELFQYLGKVYGNLGDLGPAHYNLGRYFQRRGQIDKAVFHFKTALKYLDRNPELKGIVEKEVKKMTPPKEEKSKPAPEDKKGPRLPAGVFFPLNYLGPNPPSGGLGIAGGGDKGLGMFFFGAFTDGFECLASGGVFLIMAR